jgi:hypothetical protein
MFGVPDNVWRHNVQIAQRDKIVRRSRWEWLTETIDNRRYAREHGDDRGWSSRRDRSSNARRTPSGSPQAAFGPGRLLLRDWRADTSKPAHLAEAALAYVTGNAVVQAYARSDMLERRGLMEAWGEFLTRPPAEVVPPEAADRQADGQLGMSAEARCSVDGWFRHRGLRDLSIWARS